MKTKRKVLSAILVSSLFLAGTARAITVDALRCEYQVNPIGVDSPQPRLSWLLQSDERDQSQTAYQVLVGSSPRILDQDQGDIWDSGVKRSDQTFQVPYSGAPLQSAQRLYWKVRVWDQGGKPTRWSPVARWTMGLNEADWAAKWIGAPDVLKAPTLAFRKQFDVKQGLVRALVFVCGLGQYEMTLNGKKVGNDLLTPGWSKYDKTCLYDTYDITTDLNRGANAVGLLLGNGMYNVIGGRYTKFKGSFGPQKAIAQIVIEYSDGSFQVIGTDDQWKVAPGPITFSCVYGGEDYDARLEQKGWNETGFDDAKWSAAAEEKGPGGKLRGLSAAAPQLREIQVFKPAKITERTPSIAIYDLGQNTSYMLRMRVKGPAGTVVKVTPAELLRADGSLNRGSAGGGEAYWKYTLAGGNSEDYFSKFFYHGCRYLQVERTAAEGAELPVVEGLEGVVVHSTAEPIGDFSCSNELFNQTHTLIRWAQRSNMVSVLSDCPHRERLGWLEQVYLNGDSLRYEFDLAQFFTKTMNDMVDSQLDDGLVPAIAPEYTKFGGDFRDSPEWGSAIVQAAWQQYEWDGDVQLLREHYDAMKRYVAYLKGKSKDGIVSHGLGDWYDLGPKAVGPAQLTPKATTATAIYWSDIMLMEKVAKLLGKDEDARMYATLGGEVREAFNKTQYKPEAGYYATNSQTANAIAYAMGLVESENAQKVLDNIVKDIRDRGNALTAGDVGYHYLLRALAMGGRSDVIFDMNNQSDRPGYGYQIKHGATALTEGWSGQNSQNHFMLGHIMEWFYHDLAGLQRDPQVPGFKRIIVKPGPVGDVTWARASLNSISGTIVSEWKKENQQMHLHIVLPPNTSATVFVPTKDADSVQEGGKPVAQVEGVQFLRKEGDAAVYQVESGDYTFVSKI